MLKNFKLTLNRLIMAIFVLFFCWVLAAVIAWLFIAYSEGRSFFLYQDIYNSKLNPVIVIIGAIILLSLLLLISLKLRKLSKSAHKMLFYAGMSILVLLQLIFAAKIRVNPQVWDFSSVYETSVSFVNGASELGHYYYDDYPNNISLSLLLAGIFKLSAFAGIYDFIPVGVLFNILMLDAGIILTCLTSKKLFRLHIATLTLLICLFYTPFITYVPIFYSDTISMPFGAGMIYFYLMSRDTEARPKRYFYIFLLSVCATIGILLKPTIAIAVAALLIYIFLTGKATKAIGLTAAILSVYISGIFLYSRTIDQSGMMPVALKDAGYPASHWVMMGLKEPFGFYDAQDVIYTESFISKDLRSEANAVIIRNRLSNYGFEGLFKLFTVKNIFIWGDGTYFAPIKLNRKIQQMTELHRYVLPLDKNENTVYIYLCSITQLALLFSMLLSGLAGMTDNRIGMQTAFTLTVLGAGLFYMVWEARSRYLINISPMLLLCSIGWLAAISPILPPHGTLPSRGEPRGSA